MLNFKDTQKIKSLNEPFGSKMVKEVNRFNSLYQAWNQTGKSDWMLWWLRCNNLIDQKQRVQLMLIFAKHIEFIIYKKNSDIVKEYFNRVIKLTCDWLEKPSETIINAAEHIKDQIVGKSGIAYDIEYNLLYDIINNKSSVYRMSENCICLVENYPVLANSDAEIQFQADTIREQVQNPFILEHERLGLDKDTADPWKDILEEI